MRTIFRLAAIAVLAAAGTFVAAPARAGVSVAVHCNNPDIGDQQWNNRVPGGYCLYPGDYLWSGYEVDGVSNTSLIYQASDGNLVIYYTNRYGEERAVWATNWGHSPGVVAMQGDGNFVIYDSGGKALCASHTDGNPGAVLDMWRDGGVEITRRGNSIWAPERHGMHCWR